MDGETISVTICSGGTLVTLTIPLDGEEDHSVNTGCEFFSGQAGAAPVSEPNADPVSAEARVAGLSIFTETVSFQPAWYPQNPRAPPFVS